MKDAFIVNYTIILIKVFIQNTNVTFEKASGLSMPFSCDENLTKKLCAAILTGISKVFYSICHDLLIAKLNAYGFNWNALKLIYDYVSDRSQKTVGSSFSAYLDIIYGVPQGSVLGPVLFNFFFFEDYGSDFASFADDTTPYECARALIKSWIALK